MNQEDANKDKAVRTVARQALRNLPESVGERIQLYKALAVILPSEQERFDAKRVAWTYEEAENHQLKFQALLHGGIIGDGDGEQIGS